MSSCVAVPYHWGCRIPVQDSSSPTLHLLALFAQNHILVLTNSYLMAAHVFPFPRCFASRLAKLMMVSTVGRQSASGKTLASQTKRPSFSV